MLAYITGTVDQELLLRNEYLAAENRILRAQIKGRLLLSNFEKATFFHPASLRTGSYVLSRNSVQYKERYLTARPFNSHLVRSSIAPWRRYSR